MGSPGFLLQSKLMHVSQIGNSVLTVGVCECGDLTRVLVKSQLGETLAEHCHLECRRKRILKMDGWMRIMSANIRVSM